MPSSVSIMSGKAPRHKGPDEKRPILIGLIALLGLLLAVLVDKAMESMQERQAVYCTSCRHEFGTPTREFNLALGERRAYSAKNYLAALGVPISRIRVVSYGNERPEMLGSDEQAWAQNRRAVTVVIR